MEPTWNWCIISIQADIFSPQAIIIIIFFFFLLTRLGREACECLGHIAAS